MPTIEPLTPQPHLHVFAGYGIELEYMLVDSDTLAVAPMADRLLAMQAGEVLNEVVCGELAWSNELVLHVIELKTNGPASSLDGLAERFHEAIRRINLDLSPMRVALLPTAMHPLFRPDFETRLWPHGQNEIYATYDRIFRCRGHGWSNLQSMHINLPFADDREFRRLHAAIRAVLPLIPALAAASPLVEGDWTGWMDSRLRFYRDNQKRIPEIAGQVVPESVASIDEYQRRILEPMYAAIRPFDPDGILSDDWLNSRGAIARFERQTIEIRVIDTQECPAADLAIAEALVALIKRLHDHDELIDRDRRLDTASLARQLFAAARDGAAVHFDDRSWLRLLGVEAPCQGGELWVRLVDGLALGDAARRTLTRMLERGTLAEAIRRRLGEAPQREGIVSCYRELGICLAENRLFLP